MFEKRLENYRNEKNINKREMANQLKISESYYNLIESGKRSPSKKFLYQLVLLSNKPEEYWLYGITDKNELLDVRENFKCTKIAFDYWNNLNELNSEIIKKLFDKFECANSMEKTLIKGLRADLEHLLEKSKK